MRIRSVVVFLALAVLELALVGRAAITDPVQVEQGLLAGTSGSTAEHSPYSWGFLFAAAAGRRSALEARRLRPAAGNTPSCRIL